MEGRTMPLLVGLRQALLGEPEVIDEATGLGTRQAFERDLAREIAAVSTPHGGWLALALVGLDGLDGLTVRSGRRWADQQLITAGAILTRLSECDRELTAYRIGAHTFAVVLTDTDLDQAFAIADAIHRRIERDAEGIGCSIGLAQLDRVKATDAETLELAADAALDQAYLLGAGRVVAAADQASGLRWIASRPFSSRPSSTSSAAE
jgi:GGDEF domain-containing protein